MTKVFIGGSRRVTRLNGDVRQRLDRIIERGLCVLIGDANGADRVVQRYLHSRGYDKVEVFCVEGTCRNNVGRWRTRVVDAPETRKGFEYYAAKDVEMAKECSVGLMLWDGKSRGTLTNISRLVGQGKKVVVYILPARVFATLGNGNDWDKFLYRYCKDAPEQIRRWVRPLVPQAFRNRQAGLF